MGALFICLWHCATVVAPAQAAQTCSAKQFDERVAVARVTDGDTLRLQDGRALRLIGINAPELAHDGTPAEDMAQAARAALEAVLEGVSTVGLQYGRERHDRYQRLLAHVYLPSGASVQAGLLKAGMGAHIVVPPNVAHLACYRDAERQARTAEKGVWQGIYRPLPVADLGKESRGFKRVSGRIGRIGESKKSVWLNFSGPSREGERERLAVRIAREDLAWFSRWRPQSLLGKHVVVRGWVTAYSRSLVMRVRHPASIEILP